MTETQHKATMEIVSQGKNREGDWTTEEIRERLIGLGFDIKGANVLEDDNQLHQVVTITGTRDEIIAQRDKITRSIKGVAGCRVPAKFNLVF